MTHLIVKGLRSSPFLNSNSLNIKVLALAYKNSDSYEIPSENMKNIEKLSLDVQKEEHVLAIIQKCPKLTELNLDIEEWLEQKNASFISSINEILELVPALKCLGIIENILLKQQVTREELFSKISRKIVFLRVYDCFKSMLADEWGRDDVEHMRI